MDKVLTFLGGIGTGVFLTLGFLLLTGLHGDDSRRDKALVAAHTSAGPQLGKVIEAAPRDARVKDAEPSAPHARVGDREDYAEAVDLVEELAPMSRAWAEAFAKQNELAKDRASPLAQATDEAARAVTRIALAYLEGEIDRLALRKQLVDTRDAYLDALRENLPDDTVDKIAEELREASLPYRWLPSLIGAEDAAAE